MVHSIRPKLRTVATPTFTFSRLGTTLVGHPAIHRCCDQGCSRQNARRSEQAIKCSIVSPEGSIQQGAFCASVGEDFYHLQYGKSLLRFFPSVGRQRQRLSAELFSQSLESGVSFA